MTVTVCLSVTLVVTVLAFVWLLDRRDVRERAERANLLNRIQAPEAGVAQSFDPEPETTQDPFDLARFEEQIQEHLEPAP